MALTTASTEPTSGPTGEASPFGPEPSTEPETPATGGQTTGDQRAGDQEAVDQRAGERGPDTEHAKSTPLAFTSPVPALRGVAKRIAHRYTNGETRPLGGYLTLLAAYGGTVLGLSALARVTGRRPPERVAPGDLALMTVATYKLSRLLTKDAVTSPLRAPLTQYSESAGEGEVNEEVAHQGRFRHAAGELVSCPFCSSVWVSTGFAAGLVFAPRVTRLVATTLTAVAGADMLQFAYTAAREKVE